MPTSSIILVVTMVLVVVLLLSGLGAMACKRAPLLAASASLVPRNAQEARDAAVAEYTLVEAQWKCSPDTANARGKNTPTRLTRRDGQTHVECMSPKGSGRGCLWVSPVKCQQLVDNAVGQNLTCGPDHEAKYGKGKTGYQNKNHWCKKQMITTVKGYEKYLASLNGGAPKEDPMAILTGLMNVTLFDLNINWDDMDQKFFAAVRRIMSENTCDELNKPRKGTRGIRDGMSVYKTIVDYLLVIRSNVQAAKQKRTVDRFYEDHLSFILRIHDAMLEPTTTNNAFVIMLKGVASKELYDISQEYMTLLSECV